MENKFISKPYYSYIRDLVIHCSARKKCKFPLPVSSTMGDTHMHISSPSPRENECKLEERHSRLQNLICHSYDHKIDTRTQFCS